MGELHEVRLDEAYRACRRINARYGRTPFTFGAPVGDFYRILLIAMAAGAGMLVAMAGVFFLDLKSKLIALQLKVASRTSSAGS